MAVITITILNSINNFIIKIISLLDIGGRG